MASIVGETLFMPKALCIAGMAISILVALVFLVDLILPFAGMAGFAPFGHHTALWIDAVMAVCALMLTYLSWSTWREQ